MLVFNCDVDRNGHYKFLVRLSTAYLFSFTIPLLRLDPQPVLFVCLFVCEFLAIWYMTAMDWVFTGSCTRKWKHSTSSESTLCRECHPRGFWRFHHQDWSCGSKMRYQTHAQHGILCNLRRFVFYGVFACPVLVNCMCRGLGFRVLELRCMFCSNFRICWGVFIASV